MTFAVTFGWWVIPAAITILAILWALFWPFSGADGGLADFVMRGMLLVPALLVSAIAWAVAGWLK